MTETKRMTDVEFERRIQVEPNTRVAMSVAYVEATRARAREEEQEAIAQEQAATIKALADALAEAKDLLQQYVDGTPISTGGMFLTRARIDDALRLAKRIP